MTITLLKVGGVSFLPGGSFEIPVPTLRLGDFEDMNIMRIKVPVLDQAVFLGTDEIVGAVSDIVGANLVSSKNCSRFRRRSILVSRWSRSMICSRH